MNNGVKVSVVCSILVMGAGSAHFSAAGEAPPSPSPTATEIRSPFSGSSVVRTVVPDGAEVKQGDMLATLDNSKLQAEVKRQQTEIATEEGELRQSNIALEAARERRQEAIIAERGVKLAELQQEFVKAELEFEWSVLEREISLSRHAHELAKKKKPMIVEHTGDAVSFEAAMADLEIARALGQLETAEARKKLLQEKLLPLKQSQAEHDLMRAKLNASRIQRATAMELHRSEADVVDRTLALKQKQARLKKLEDFVAQSTIRAPHDGTVRHVPGTAIREGSVVREGQTILTLSR